MNVSDEIKSRLIRLSIPPSFYVRGSYRIRAWCSLSVCPGCRLRAKREDMHPVNPCPRCGSLSLQEQVGRWHQLRPWWKFWGPEGYWELLTEQAAQELAARIVETVNRIPDTARELIEATKHESDD